MPGYIVSFPSLPSTTNDAFWRHQFLAACYQLAQSILKIGSVLVERMGQGEVGGRTLLADSGMAAVVAACVVNAG